jgi:2-keto-4-pentenoate hydratase
MMAFLDDARIVAGMRTQLAARRKRLGAGETGLGWKVGFGAPAALARLGLAAPLVGHLMQSGRRDSDATVSLKGWTKPVAEPEICVLIGADVAGGGSCDDAKGAIAALGPAIELADMDIPPDDVETILSGNIFQRNVVVGPRSTAHAGAKLDGLTGVITRRGVEAGRMTDLEVNTGKVVDIVRHVADVLAAFGETLRAGEIIICGSVFPPVFVEPDEDGFSFTLEPIGTASVRLTH